MGGDVKILAKLENLNPGGSIKDRAALYLIEDAERKGLLKPGDCIVEGTGGNTGIGLAVVANAKGYKMCFAMPASIAQEKIDMMKTFGAEVILTPGVPFTDPRHYFHVAATRGREAGHFFTNQFENTSNAMAHIKGTGPEILAQVQAAGGRVDGFVCAAGTGGTIGGIGSFLKSKLGSAGVCCMVIDPHGSGLFDYVRSLPGPAAGFVEGKSPSSPAGQTRYDGDRTVKYIERSPGSSITEGIGIDRVTANFSLAAAAGCLDGAMQGTDREAVEMAYHVLKHDGLFIGPSAALNVVGAVKLARDLKKKRKEERAKVKGSDASGTSSDEPVTVVTVICDGGDRYQSKLWNRAWLETNDLVPRDGPPAENPSVDVDGVWFVEE